MEISQPASSKIHPGYVPGNWYLPLGITASFSTGVAPGNGSIRLALGYIDRPVAINALGGRIQTVSASGNWQAAIYAADPTTKRPTGAALAATPSMATGAAASVNGAVNVTLQPGFYWFASNCDNAVAIPTMISSASPVQAQLVGSPTQANDMLSNNGFISGLSVAQAFGTWPDLTAASFTEVVASSIPVVQFKVA